MGGVKHSAAAGLFAIFGVASPVLVQLAAQAAELPSLPDAPALPSAQSAGNLYVRADFGVAAYETGRWTKALDSLAGDDEIQAAGFTSKSLGEAAFIGAGLGYELHPWIRADITAEYRGSARLRGTLQETVLGPLAPLTSLRRNEFAGSLQTAVVMTSVYADIGTWHGFTPYLGAGLGLSRHDLSGVTRADSTSNNAPNGVSPAGAFGPMPRRTTTGVSWSLMAGLAYTISPNLKLDLGYRHLDLGDIRSGSINCICGESSTGLKLRNVASNEIRVGVRWLFGEAGPALGESDELPEIPR